MRFSIFFILFSLTSLKAAKIVEEIVLRDGNQKQRQERRFENGANLQQEVEIVYEEPNGDEIIEDIVIEQAPEEDQGPVTPNSVHRGLVPQLWPNYTGPAEEDPETVSCNVARMKCAYRTGCGLALQNYALGCLDLAKGKTQVCNTHCRHSLIALMSTHEGQRLMKCNCSGDSFCEQSKTNIRACQEEVMYATQDDTIVSCTAAQWICSADPLCSTALEYYNRFCHAMFKGKKCTDRCMNSISILRRQPKANKLETCYCDGSEDFDCVNIKKNMDSLCFKEDDIMDNEIDVDNKSGASSWTAKLERFVILFTIIAGLIVNFVAASLTTMVESLRTIDEEPPAPPEEIGVH